MGSIPSDVAALLRGTHALSPVSPNLVDTFVGRLCFASPCSNNNLIVRSLFQQNIITLLAVTIGIIQWVTSAGKKCGCFLILIY